MTESVPMSQLIRRADGDGRRATRVPPDRAVPERWTQVHVMDRLEEAYEILSRLPMNTRPKGAGSAWPVYAYERFDLIAQIETGEFDRLMKVQNRIRIAPTADQIARMEEAIAWPIQLLADLPEVARAVQLGSLWVAMKRDPGRECKKLKINRRFFNKQKMHGITVLAMRLAVMRVTVR